MKVETFFRIWFFYLTFQWKRYLLELQLEDTRRKMNILRTSHNLNKEKSE